MNETEKLIIATLDKIRPFLQRDGGDIQFVSFEDGVVNVSVHGACQGCSLIGVDISETVEVILQEEVPGVIRVQVVS